MSDFEDLPVETVAGDRPASTVADRLLIGLALVALLGGALIALGNLLGVPAPETAETRTPSPRAEVTPPIATPRAEGTRAPLDEVTVVPGEPPDAGEPQISETFWLEAVRPLVLRSSTSEGALELGRLEPGTVAVAERQPDMTDGWVYVYEPQPGGYVRVVGLDGRDRARLFPVATPIFDGTVSAVAAGPGGFVARGLAARSDWQPSETAPLYSEDGEHWRVSPTSLRGDWYSSDVAWGPSGWLAVGHVQDPDHSFGSLWVWESADGRLWEPVGSLDLPGEVYVSSLVASGSGYLLVLNSASNGEARLWYSPDGILWQEGVHPFEGMSGRPSYEFGMNLRVSATAVGFLAWRNTEGLATNTPAAFSSNGRSWSRVSMEDGSGSWLHLAVVGDTLLGLGRDADGIVRAYSGDVAGDPIQLTRTPHQDLAFDGVVLWNVVSDGTSAWAFGYERASGASMAWRSNGGTWARIAVPAGGFGGPLYQAAAGPAGVVVVGTQRQGIAADPVFWHLRPDGTWVREPSPILPPLPQPGLGDCGEAPDTALEFMALDPHIAVPCYGDGPMTFTAWSARCQGCGGVTGAGRMEPAWLLQPERELYLLPAEMSMDGGWSKQAILHHTLEWGPELADTWIRITGHFDDPASQTCRWHPRPDEEPYYWGPEADVASCRSRFVVTDIEVVAGPAGE